MARTPPARAAAPPAAPAAVSARPPTCWTCGPRPPAVGRRRQPAPAPGRSPRAPSGALAVPFCSGLEPSSKLGKVQPGESSTAGFFLWPLNQSGMIVADTR